MTREQVRGWSLKGQRREETFLKQCQRGMSSVTQPRSCWVKKKEFNACLVEYKPNFSNNAVPLPIPSLFPSCGVFQKCSRTIWSMVIGRELDRPVVKAQRR